MKFFFSVLLLATASVMTDAKAIPFKTCEKPAFIPRYVSIDPFPPKAGGTLKITFKGPGKVAAEGGIFSYKIWYSVKVLGIQKWVELDGGKGDICKYTKCPIKKGYVTVKYSRNLPSIMPPGNYRIRVEAKDLDDGLLMCVELHVDIKAAIVEGEGSVVYDIPVLLDPYPVEV